MNQKCYVKQDGFTLIEIAIVITIIGVLTAGFLSTIQPIFHQSKLTATEANMNNIINVISGYAQRNNRIPCPSDPDQSSVAQPFGTEFGSGAAGDNVGECDDPGAGDIIEGVVPFKTLGLSLDDIKDGWGNFITYRVSPVFAQDTTDALNVHKRCRVDGLWIDSGSNRNPAKARFCCPDLVLMGNDIVIDDENGDEMWVFDRDAAAISYSTAGEVIASGTTFDITDDNVTQIAFVLISHGANRYGAFLPNGGRTGGTAGAFGDDEEDNQDPAEDFVTAPMNTREGNNHFDDIVMWRTQDQTYAETGAGSCSFP